jgi:hypothetical protein
VANPAAGPEDGRPPRARWRAPFEWEDALLALWLLALGAWLAPWLGADHVLPLAGPPSWLAWAALAAYAVVFFTRGPDDGDLDRALMRRLFSIGPLIYIVGPLALLANFLLGRVRRARCKRLGTAPPRPATGWPGPPLSPPLRRTLALPFAIVGEGVFRRMAGAELEHWGAGRFVDGAFVLERPVFALFAVAVLVAGYGLLVMGPRVVAGAALDWRLWVPRFLLYLAAAVGGSRLSIAGS